MAGFIVRRFLSTIAVVLVASFVLFALLYVIPGNPAVLEVGSSASPAVLSHLERTMGLDLPWYTRYAHWLTAAVQGRLGTSYVSNYTVTSLIGERAAVTIELALGGILLGMVIGVPLGFLAGMRDGTRLSRFLDFVVALGVGLPVFFVAIVLQLAVALTLHWLPAANYTPLSQGIVPNIQSMILPCITLAVGLAAVNVRFASAGIREVRKSNLVMAAQVLGLRRRTIMWKVLARNSLIPLVTVIGLQIGYTLGGVILVEEVFNLPGLGTLLWNSVTERDYFVIQGVMLLAVAIFAVVNFLVDVSYGFLDPRVRTTRG